MKFDRESNENDDHEIAGYAVVTCILAIAAPVLSILRHPLFGAASFGACCVSLYLTRQAAHRLNRTPDEPSSPSSLKGRLDIYRATGL